MNVLPWIRTTTGARTAEADFGWRVVTMLSRAAPVRADGDSIEARLNRQVDFISTLPALGDGAAVELRFACEPSPERPQAGQIEILLRVSIREASAEAALRRAQAARDCLWPNLLGLIEGLLWEPVREAAELERRSALPQALGREVVRRELRLEPGDVAPLRRPIGFVHASEAREPVTQPSGIRFVCPFVRPYVNLDGLFQAMLRSSKPSTVIVAVAPTRMREDEERDLLSQIEACERFLQAPIGPASSPGEIIPTPVSQTRAALSVLLGAQQTLADDCFHVRCVVFADEGAVGGLAHLVGAHATEPVGTADGLSDARMLKLEHAGGFALRSFDPAVDVLDPRVSVARKPEGTRLLRLMDARQANALFRLPIPIAGDFPGLDTVHHRSLSVPGAIGGGTLSIGRSRYGSVDQSISLALDDRRRHMYVVGETGTGKSTLMLNLMRQDAAQGHGFCLIDPHGGLARELMDLLSEKDLARTRYFCPAERETIIGLNLLEADDPFEQESAVGALMDIFEKLYDMKAAGGPMFELILRQACKLMFRQRKLLPGLKNLSRLIADPAVRKQALQEANDVDCNNFWLETFARFGGEWGNAANWTAYVTSKFSRQLENELIGPLVAETLPVYDFRGLMDGGGILVVNLAKGRIGRAGCSFLGMLLVNLILRAAFSRQAIPEAQRRDFFLYVDEFQNLATEAFAELLAEARQHRVSTVLANQYLDQLPGEVLRALIGNVGTLMSLRVGIKDAALLEEWFAPSLNRQDLTNLPNFQAYVKTLVNGEAVRAFDVILEPAPDRRKLRRVAVPRAAASPLYDVAS